MDEPIAVEAVEAVATTVADPSLFNIVADLELACKLLIELKAKIAGLHPSVSNILKALL